MKNYNTIFYRISFLLLIAGFTNNVWAQNQEINIPMSQSDVATQQEQPLDPFDVRDQDSDETIEGSLSYKPIRDESGLLRDPFKSPFELEREAEERRRREMTENASTVIENRNDIVVASTLLKGIYLEKSAGYWAIFEVDGVYKWFQIGEKFKDGDLVNITDNSVHFLVYEDGFSEAPKEIIKELHQGEE